MTDNVIITAREFIVRALARPGETSRGRSTL